MTNSLVVNLAGSAQVAPTFWLNPENGVSYPIVIQTPQYRLDSLGALENMPVTGGNTTGPQFLGGSPASAPGTARWCRTTKARFMIALVRIALSRPYTFVVLALLLLIIGPLAALRTPTDIFPDIRIPVIGVVWQYTGLPPDQMAGRITTPFQRALTTTVNDIEHIDRQLAITASASSRSSSSRMSTSAPRTPRSPRSRRP